MRIFAEVVRRQHAIEQRMVEVQIWQFGTHKRVKIARSRPSTKRVVTMMLQFARTATTKNETHILFLNQPMHLVEQSWHFHNLVDDDNAVAWLVLQQFEEQFGATLETTFCATIEQVEKDGILECLF